MEDPPQGTPNLLTAKSYAKLDDNEEVKDSPPVPAIDPKLLPQHSFQIVENAQAKKLLRQFRSSMGNLLTLVQEDCAGGGNQNPKAVTVSEPLAQPSGSATIVEIPATETAKRNFLVKFPADEKFANDDEDDDRKAGALPSLHNVKIDLISLIPTKINHIHLELEFFGALEEEMKKCVAFYETECKHFREQIELAFYCLLELDSIEKLQDSKAKEERLRELPRQFWGGKRSVRQLFRDLYYGLGLLKNFHVVNYLAVVKILKKHDKSSSGWVDSCKTLIAKLDSGEMYPSIEPIKGFIVAVEKMFLRHLSENKEKSKALESLRQHDGPEESHLVTFGAGFSFGAVIGVTFSALVAFAIADRTSADFSSYFFTVDKNQSTVKTEIASAIPIFRLMFLIAFHLLMWGVDLLVYERRKINARFIMDADPRSFLKSNQVILIAVSLLTLVIADVLFYTISVAYKSSIGIDNPGYIHFVLLLTLLACSALPVDILFYQSRKYFWSCLLEIIKTPFVDVVFEHFFIADQLTSCGVVLLDLQYALVYYCTGNFITFENTKFSSTRAYTRISLLVALVPYWLRFAQCIRRAIRSPAQRSTHLWNTLKYGLAIVATLFSYFYSFYGFISLWYIWLVFKICSALDGFMWDIFQDWSIIKFTPKSEKLPFGKISKTDRFSTGNAIVAGVNLLLRLAFVLNFLMFTNAGIYGASFNREMSVWFLSTLEIYRRGQWNVLRMENEHLNNCGNFRAFQEIPPEFTFKLGSLKKHV
eukprot:TRINITY_DN6058_c0_g1_i2.p1 TRINITY_DN6058_c0_g1~~TRINITY_DN6058_c0_g1_i2.p1  ORF type:complete len:862 (+),score=230.97 TRINITY_DN6058_c0_g1_i2:308-2587(+)